MSVLEIVIACGTALAAARAVHLAIVLGSIPRLRDVVPRAPTSGLPGVTIAVAARDEGEHLERAARSWLAQDAQGLQVIVVDDRSRDETPGILARLAAEDARLLPLRVDERPEGWLGKCHAQQLAASRATGDFILFTDADVRLEPDTLRRALGLAVAHDADVVALMPDVECEGIVQGALTAAFFHFFLTAMGGRGANRDDGRCAIGVGAFNLVRRSAYEAVEGHSSLRLQVGDDVGLVRLLQRAGFRHRLLSGEGLVALRWQPGVIGTIRGLEKNFFWGARFSVLLVAGFTAATLLMLSPLLAPLSSTPLAWACFGAWLAASAAPYFVGAAAPRGRLAAVLLHPLSLGLLVVAAWNSTIRTLARGGISWRGDVFPLRDLRAGLMPWRWWREAVPSRPPRAAGGDGGHG